MASDKIITKDLRIQIYKEAVQLFENEDRCQKYESPFYFSEGVPELMFGTCKVLRRVCEKYYPKFFSHLQVILPEFKKYLDEKNLYETSYWWPLKDDEGRPNIQPRIECLKEMIQLAEKSTD